MFITHLSEESDNEDLRSGQEVVPDSHESGQEEVVQDAQIVDILSR